MTHPSATTAWNSALCEEIVRCHHDREGALLPILHDLQDQIGWIPDEAVAQVAAALNLSRAEVHGTVTFYHDFRRAPAGRRIIKLCQAEACQARGAHAVRSAMEAALGTALGATSADGEVTLEPVYCLGLCASGPAALVDGRPLGRLDAAAARQLAEEALG